MKTLARMKGEIPKVDIKAVPEDDDLAEALRLAIDKTLDDAQTGKFRQYKGFHASETNECPRYLIYMFRGRWLPSNISARLQRIFDNGHSFHARIGKLFESMGIVKGLEKPVNTTILWKDSKGVEWEIPIESTCDGVITWGEEESVIEFKSIGDAGYARLRIFKKPKVDHIRQVQIYMAALGLKSAYVIYENKNTQMIMIFRVEYDEEFINKLFKKYAKIYKAYKDGKLAPRYSSPTSQHCQYCNLRDECWADSDPGVKI